MLRDYRKQVVSLCALSVSAVRRRLHRRRRRHHQSAAALLAPLARVQIPGEAAAAAAVVVVPSEIGPALSLATGQH